MGVLSCVLGGGAVVEHWLLGYSLDAGKETHSLPNGSNTSTICSILLLAESSSDPTVIRTGSLRKVAAKRLTVSGHVAETVHQHVAPQKGAKKLTHDGLPSGGLIGTVGDDTPNVILETCIQHPVGFVKGKVLNTEDQFPSQSAQETTHPERSRSPESAKSKRRPGVPTTILLSLIPAICSILPTPP